MIEIRMKNEVLFKKNYGIYSRHFNKISYPQLILIRSRLWQANSHITSKCLARISMTFCKLLYPLPRNNSIMQEIAIEVCNKENKSCPNDVLIRLNTNNFGVLGLLT